MAIETDINKALLDDIYAIYSQAETEMLEKVAKRVAKGITTEGWNERKLSEVQKLKKDIEKNGICLLLRKSTQKHMRE